MFGLQIYFKASLHNIYYAKWTGIIIKDYLPVCNKD
jgi:hypothetical protein